MEVYDLVFDSLQRDFSHLDEVAADQRAIANSMYDGLHPVQRDLVDDPSRRKSALCPRRSGKSWTAMTYAHLVCLEKPKSVVVIVCLTLASAKNIYWFDIKDFAQLYGLDLEYYSNELRIMFPNGSRIMFIGADKQTQIDKLRGGKYDLVVIDEAKSYAPLLLDELINDAIWPALGDRQGTLMMIGTPGNILDGPFFEATFPNFTDENDRFINRTYNEPERHWVENPRDEPLWSRHSWTRKDNLALPHLWDEALETKRINRWKDDHPTWLREFLGQWVPSESSFVYAYCELLRNDPRRVTWEPAGDDHRTALGLDKRKDYRYLLGLDLGFVDDTAVVIGAYCPDDGELIEVYSEKLPHQDVDQVARLIEKCQELVPEFDAMIADMGGLGTQIVETLRRRYGYNIQPAEKKEKFDYIELLNTDFHSGRVKLRRHGDLSIEMQVLQWDLSKGGKEFLSRTGRLKEHAQLPNHLCDAWLYIWRYSYHFWKREPIHQYKRGTIAWQKEMEAKAMEHLINHRNRQADTLFAELNHDDGPDAAEQYDFYCRLGRTS